MTLTEKPSTPYRLLIVDDHVLFCQGMEVLLSRWDDFDVVGIANSGADGIRQAAILRPDIILMDVRMEGEIDGIEATKLISSDNPDVRVVMLTVSELGDNLFAALRNGAWGYLNKNEPADRLHENLRSVMRGETVVSSHAANIILNELGCSSPKIAYPQLTPREIDVLRLVVEGLSNEEIAERIHISEGTVKKRLGSVMTKWHMRNRVQIAVHAVRKGIV
ncbi:response regulator [Trueperella sp. LYQ143]|uniref:response regulator n=1 Tax=unclassified Trueperella TaxID=2630174 RepID=UPI00398361D2